MCIRLKRYWPDKMASEIFSAVINVGKFVFAQGTTGENRRVDHPQSVDAAHAAGVVGHRHQVVVRSHPAGTGGVPDTDRSFAHEFLDGVVVCHHLFERVALHDEFWISIARSPDGPSSSFAMTFVRNSFFLFTRPT